MRLLIFFLSVLSAQSATIRFAITNSDLTPCTNTLRIFPVTTPIRVDGSWDIRGISSRLPLTNGVAAIRLSQGNYYATNTGYYKLFAVPTGTGVYDATSLEISGGNVYNYTPANISVAPGTNVTVETNGNTFTINATGGSVPADVVTNGQDVVEFGSATVSNLTVLGTNPVFAVQSNAYVPGWAHVSGVVTGSQFIGPLEGTASNSTNWNGLGTNVLGDPIDAARLPASVASTTYVASAVAGVASGVTRTYYVSPTGLASHSGLTSTSPWPLGYAISNAPANSTLFLLPGHYTWSTSIALTTPGLTLKCSPKWSAVITNVAGVHPFYATYPAHNITYDGLAFRNNEFDLVLDWDDTGVSNCVVRNCWFSGTGNGFAASQSASGVEARGVNQMVENCLSEWNGTNNVGYNHGIYAGGPGGVYRNNVIRYNGGAGFILNGHGIVMDDQNQIYNNLIYHNFSAGSQVSIKNSGATGTNYIYGNTIIETNETFAIRGEATTTMVFTNNILVSLPNNGFYSPGTKRHDYNLAPFDLGEDHGVIADPGFVSTNSGLYWLTRASQARGKALAGSAGAVDFFGNAQASVSDIGAFQYQFGTASDARVMDPSPAGGADYWLSNPDLVVPGGIPTSALNTNVQALLSASASTNLVEQATNDLSSALKAYANTGSNAVQNYAIGVSNRVANAVSNRQAVVEFGSATVSNLTVLSTNPVFSVAQDAYVPGFLHVSGVVTGASFHGPLTGTATNATSVHNADEDTHIYSGMGNLYLKALSGEVFVEQTIHGHGNVTTDEQFIGNGSGVTNLYATNLVGTVADARLSTNVVTKTGTNVFSGTNTFNGVTVMNGNVGIGTTNPAYKLDIGGKSGAHYLNSFRAGFALFGGGSGNEYDYIGYNAVPVATGGDTYKYDADDTASLIKFHSGGFQFQAAGSGTAGNTFTGSTKVTILNSGNVGIGTVAPTAKLQVDGTTASTLFAVNTNQLVVTNGNVGIGTTTPSFKLTSYGGEGIAVQDANGALRMTTASGINYIQSGTGYSASSADLRFNSMFGSGNISMTLKGDTGNVGIGTTTPTNKLEVIGNAHIVGDLSCSNVVDLSASPDSLTDAVAIVNSIETVNGKVNHAKLSPLAWGTKEIGNGTFTTNSIKTVIPAETNMVDEIVGSITNKVPRVVGSKTNITTTVTEGTAVVPDQSKRSLSMVVSAQALVIKDLLKRVEALETRVNKLEWK